MTIYRALTIAGSAARGGAGIQADIKTFQERDVFGMSAITAIVAPHPITRSGIFPQSIEAIEAQYYTAVNDIGIDALKTGMLFSEEVILRVAELLEEKKFENLVVDPVIIGKMGSQLLKDDAVNAMKEKLFPLAKMITPNMPEAAKLLNILELKSINDMKEAAIELHKLGPHYVLIKGGRLKGPAIDILYDGNTFEMFEAERIDTINTNGAGCTYSAAITAELAKGKSVHEAVKIAKDFITVAIRHSLSFKDQVGPTNHSAYRKYNH
ncbi:bifunctional hydroxymethylpyrimidine kinase/phosphomethylpyrimidine kinase [Bacillus aquiflavi]|uniref:pyridoxal kinase n=1 Tax=Bacillus aquiflavi TaxID=2672567 RepID=A0A6B3VYR0_9BACI|nr:bifunctional hydroxymethylpyrimidine kinase/phosphomethylpyrimidine kinase [Bacillus aquiflavi]MBA4536536.1 bifunctional hydroxymethylpyrimidine kinase/phosphomethylpyrimidine kinase [Bacillus aquiflavi]NEY80903.1 bifunctional hydroxymethylpyrimidine kinase/phosphomethylpyrimidine kinase [Bacillus aquiflavi]UAC49623.1 bifunctional hydroxymethylpyrimidine kinase/phosphomethylpyrimidine kinase [Bacillus aquiflavi]